MTEKDVFEIVKAVVEEWAWLVGLCGSGFPDDAFNREVNEITPTAFQSNCVNELTDKVHETFVKSFSKHVGADTYTSQKQAREVAEIIDKGKAAFLRGEWNEDWVMKMFWKEKT